MNRERLLELAGVPLTEAKKCKCGCDPKTCGCKADCKCGCNAVTEMHHEENEYEEELPVTSSTGYEDTFKNEEEESVFSTMTKEGFRDIEKSVSMAYDRVLGDLKRGRGREELVIAVEEEALDLVERQCDDVIRRLGQQVNKEINDKAQQRQ